MSMSELKEFAVFALTPLVLSLPESIYGIMRTFQGREFQKENFETHRTRSSAV